MSRVVQAWRRWRLQSVSHRIDRSCFIDRNVSFGRPGVADSRGTVEVGPGCDLRAGVDLSPFGGSIRLGRHVFVGPYVVIYGHGGVEIGDDSLISTHCCVVSSNHTIPGRDAQIRNSADVPLPVKIGRDVWLGAGVSVLGGVTIGDGCVVGAGSVVTRDLPPYTTSVGIPARVVNHRS